MTMLLSPSYIAMEQRRITSDGKPSCRSFFFISTEASPAEEKSSPSMAKWKFRGAVMV